MKPSKAKYIVDKLFEITNNKDLAGYLNTKFSKNKKIYKYCPINESIKIEDNYSIINLIKRNIYLSRPSEFNDPFDSSMGLSEQVIYDQLMLGMLNEKYLDNSSIDNLKIKRDDISTFTKFTKTVQNMDVSLLKDIFSYYSVSEERYKDLLMMRSKGNDNEIFLSLFSDKDFTKRFFRNLINPDIYSESNINKITDFLTVENIKKLIEPSVQIPLISANQKENLFNKDAFYSQVESFGLDKRIVDEVTDKMHQSLADLSVKMAEYIDLNIGISCFSETNNHALMWGHYSSKHKGFCIEYDMDILMGNNPEIASLLIPVIYSENRPIIDKNVISSFNIKDGKLEVATNANRYFTRALVTKSRIWRYENEWRIISKVRDNREINFDCVSGIYLGAKASQQLVDYMKKYCREEEIELYQFSVDIKIYKLNLKKLNL